MQNLEPASFAINIVRYPITHLFTIPSIIHFLTRTDQPREVMQSLASLTSITCSAAPLGATLQNDFVEKLRLATSDGILKTKIMQEWGLTETTIEVIDEMLKIL